MDLILYQNIFNKMTTRQRFLTQNQDHSSLRYTLDINQKNQKAYKFNIPKQSQGQKNIGKLASQAIKNNTYSTPAIDPLYHSQDIRMQIKKIQKHDQSKINKSPWKINQMLKKNKSNEHLLGNNADRQQVKARLLSPPMLGQSLRNTLDINSNFIKPINKSQKQVLLENHKKKFKKGQNAIQTQSVNTNSQYGQNNNNRNTAQVKKSNEFISKSLKQKFKLLRNISSDYCSNTYMCLQINSGTIWGLKIIEKAFFQDQITQKDLIFGLKFQTYANHSNIIQVYDVFDDKDNIYVVQQFMESGNLETYCQNKVLKLTQSQIGQRTNEICSGLQYVHENQLFHGRINSEQIMVTHETCKLGRIKMSILTDNMFLCSKFQYMPPQVFIDRKYDEKSDIWGVGLIIYQMLTNNKLFAKQNSNQILKSIFKHTEIIKDLDECPEGYQNLINCLLEKNPQNRMSTQKLKKHSILDNNAFEKEWAETALLLGYDSISLSKSSPNRKDKKTDENMTSPSFLKKKVGEISSPFIQKVQSKKEIQFRNNKKPEKNQKSFKFLKKNDSSEQAKQASDKSQ